MKTFIVVITVVILIVITVILGTSHKTTTTTIAWTASEINSPVVQIIVMKKTSDDPVKYDLVETIQGVQNSGTYTIDTAKYSTIVYIQIGCPKDINVECHPSKVFGPY